MLPFRQRLTSAQRAAECEKALERHPAYVPTIVERGDAVAPRIDREKYLLPADLTGAQFAYIIRRRLNVKSSEALFFLTDNGRLVPSQELVSVLYEEHKDPTDGFLYIRYTLENAFGRSSSFSPIPPASVSSGGAPASAQTRTKASSTAASSSGSRTSPMT